MNRSMASVKMAPMYTSTLVYTYRVIEMRLSTM